MPGIVVAIDGSDHSQAVLEWAMKEAALRQALLTVLTVHQVAASYWTHNPIIYSEGRTEQEKSRQAAQDAVTKAASRLGHEVPASVTVRAVSGIPAGSWKGPPSCRGGTFAPACRARQAQQLAKKDKQLGRLA